MLYLYLQQLEAIFRLLENVTREFGINIMSTRQNLINFKKSEIKVNELSLRNINFSYNKSKYEIFKKYKI